jgi:hypothetical protein
MDALNKALMTSATGANLLPYDLAPGIMEYLGKISPLWSAMPKKPAAGKVHEWTQRTAVPAGRFEGELATPAPLISTYTRPTVQLKILRIAGGVSGFQQAVSEKFINALQAEIEGAVEGFAETLEWSILYGNKNDAYQFDGLLAFMTADAAAHRTIAAGGNFLDVDGVIALSDLDKMIDSVNAFRVGQRDRRVFLTSNQMISKISGLQTRVNRLVNSVDFEGGFRLATYRDIPMIPSSFVVPAAATTSPTITATKGNGGALATAATYWSIASVTATGEQIASATATATPETSNLMCDLAWTADATALLYKIYRGTTNTTDGMYLLTTIAAKTYDSEGVPTGYVEAYKDMGTLTLSTAVHPMAAGEESLFLVDLDATRGMQMLGMVSPLGERTDTFVSYIPLATRKSAFEFMIEGFMAEMLPYPTLNAVARRAKIA